MSRVTKWFSCRRIETIFARSFDFVVATYTINDERKEVVDFAGPYYVAGQDLLVGEDSDITGPDALAGTTVCSVDGSTPAQRIQDEYGDAELVTYDTYSKCVEDLQTGNVDAVTTDEAILIGYAAQDPENLKVVGEPFSEERYGVGLALDDTASQNAVNTALDAMLAPSVDGESAWNAALREALGNPYVDEIIARADRPDSKFPYLPDPGDLDFLDSPSTPCPPGLQ